MTETTKTATPKRAKPAPGGAQEPREAAEGPLLEVRDLKKHFPIKGGAMRRVIGQVKAVDGVSLSVNRGETVAIVGESGCGKSTTGRTIIRLEEPTGGEIIFRHPDARPGAPRGRRHQDHGRGPPADAVHLPGPDGLPRLPDDRRPGDRRAPASSTRCSRGRHCGTGSPSC